LDLGDLKAKVAPLRFEFDGETVNAKFYPHKLTPEDIARLQRQAKEEDENEEESLDTNAQMLSDVLDSWDVTAGGAPYPPTYENLLVAPQTLVARTVREILNVVGKLATPKKSKT